MKTFTKWSVVILVAGLIAGCGKDNLGNALADIITPTFPEVSATIPADGSIGVPINRHVSATFSEAMDPATLTNATFTITQGTTPVTGVVTVSGGSAIFTPVVNLAPGTLYTATITTGVTDLEDHPLAKTTVWHFTTGMTTDAIAPTVSAVTPANGTTGSALDRQVTVTFSEGMDATTITGTTFTVMRENTPVLGTVTYSGNVAIFTPTDDLTANTTHTATITTGIRDLAENPLSGNYTWRFTTGTATVAGPASIVLGNAGSFAILTKSGITDVPSSAITGNIGASPITGAAIGVSCPEVTGTIYSVDAAGPACKVTGATLLTAAVSDMETAYTNAAGRTLPDFTELGAGEIGGRTLAPGLYKWSSNVLITTNVTLSGGANDVWIFQIAGNLTQASGTKVILTGGAQAKNIFWQIAGGAGVAVGTTAHMEGTILAATAIHLQTGASINGRLLAQTAVTLDHNTVVKPVP